MRCSTISDRPRFKDTTLDTRYARVGSLAKIPCEAEGEPQPSIKWLRGMEHLYAREDYTIVGNVGTSVLNVNQFFSVYYAYYEPSLSEKYTFIFMNS